MAPPRDPLSVRYDGVVRDLMTRAARAHRNSASVVAWIASPRGEFRHRDRGGRTAHERAFTRSAYYLTEADVGAGRGAAGQLVGPPGQAGAGQAVPPVRGAGPRPVLGR